MYEERKIQQDVERCEYVSEYWYIFLADLEAVSSVFQVFVWKN